MQISRSVSTPHTFLSASTTGRNPQLPFHISSVAIPRFAWSDTQYGVPIITSLTFMAPPFAQMTGLPFLKNCYRNPRHFHRTMRVQRHRFAYAPHYVAVESPAPVRAHHDQVRSPKVRHPQDRPHRRL